MQVTKVTATVRFSQDTGKGAWKSIELGVEATISPGESWRVAQVNLYQDLGHQLKTLWKQNGTAAGSYQEDPPAVASGSQGDTGNQQSAAHFCQQHGVPFTPKNGPHGEFYSHQIEGSRTWCNESRARA
jgi:hypothetical protein